MINFVTFCTKKIIINVKEKEEKTTTSFPGSSRFPPPYWKTRRPWGRGWEKQEEGPRKQYREERLEARQLLGNWTLIVVVGQIFCSLVEKNDSACRLYHCCVSYLSSTYLWLVERSIISTTLRELRGGSKKFGKGQGTEKTENSLKIIQNLTDWMGWPISPLGRPLNPPILKSRTLAPVLRV